MDGTAPRPPDHPGLGPATNADRLSFLGRRLPPSFQLRLVAIAPGRQRAYDRCEWRDALIVVERGEVELEALGGDRRRFGPGNVLWLDGVPLRALHNPGREPALLVAVSRRCLSPAREPEATGQPHPDRPGRSGPRSSGTMGSAPWPPGPRPEQGPGH